MKKAREIYCWLGEYQSTERAQEIFNEIGEAVAGGQKVYSMPEE
jgi:hypothetical protein